MINLNKLEDDDDEECYLPQKSWFNRLTQGSPEGNCNEVQKKSEFQIISPLGSQWQWLKRAAMVGELHLCMGLNGMVCTHGMKITSDDFSCPILHIHALSCL